MRLGTDIVEIKRIRQVAERQERFASKVLSSDELELYQTMTQVRKYSFLAGRFSAKEAYGKALGTGIGTRLKFSEISILPNEQGVPTIVQGPIISPDAIISISHAQDYAVATVIINSDESMVQTAIDSLN